MTQGFPIPAAFVTKYTGVLYTLLTGHGNIGRPLNQQISAARVIESGAFPIDVARNEICRHFLDDDDSDYLLFLDTDMQHPPDIAHRLIAHGLPLVTGRYQMRKPPFYTVAMRKIGDGPRDYNAVDKLGPVSGLMPIDAAGAGALLIRRDVLEAMRIAHGDEWFRYQIGADGLRGVSEDMWFFEQAKACGYQAYLDADAVCGHVAQYIVDADWAPSQGKIQELLERAKASQVSA